MQISGTVFLNGFMHMLEVSQIVAVDMEGKTWRKILRPPGPAMSIHGDQGQLCLCIADIFNRSDLSIWILETRQYSTRFQGSQCGL
jgi:hypothetical protein